MFFPPEPWLCLSTKVDTGHQSIWRFDPVPLNEKGHGCLCSPRTGTRVLPCGSLLCALPALKGSYLSPVAWGRGAAEQERSSFLPEWTPVSRAKVRAAACVACSPGPGQWLRKAKLGHGRRAGALREREGHTDPQWRNLRAPFSLPLTPGPTSKGGPLCILSSSSIPGHAPGIQREAGLLQCFKNCDQSAHGCLSQALRHAGGVHSG